jgi:hypothetical protein
MKRKIRLAPRNPFVVPAKRRKAGAHGKTKKALRRAGNMEVQRDVGRVDTGTWLLTRHTRVRSSYIPPRCHSTVDWISRQPSDVQFPGSSVGRARGC